MRTDSKRFKITTVVLLTKQTDLNKYFLVFDVMTMNPAVIFALVNLLVVRMNHRALD